MSNVTLPPVLNKSPQPAEPTALPPPHKYDSALGRLRHLLFGRALPSSGANHQKLPVFLALPIFSSDALSSNAYATEAILSVLLATAAATGALHFALPIALGICLLLGIVVLSYRQVIFAYPNGGGAYPVSRDNLGVVASLVAAASLLVDYVLTVATSVAAGVAAIITAVPELHSHIVPMCIGGILLVTLLNLRGVREAGWAFAGPAYLFIFAILATIVAGLIEMAFHVPHVTEAARLGQSYAATQAGVGTVGIYLLLQAFSQGCTALTGVEAISNTTPLFQEPRDKNAAATTVWMGVLAVLMFAGLTLLTVKFGIHAHLDASKPDYQSVVGQVAATAWPPALHFMFYVVQYSTAIILIIAANAAFAGFPQLASMLAKDSFMPRQLANIGDRLSYSNGIILLAIAAIALVVIFKGIVDALLSLYAIGVFTSFTLAQIGMVRHWLREKHRGWQASLFFNALGAVATGAVTAIIAVSKFADGARIGFAIGPYHPHYGAWIVIVLVPIMVTLFLRINSHYIEMGAELSMDNLDIVAPRHNTVLVLVPRMHRGIVEALNYARLTSDDVRAVYIETVPDRTSRLKQAWQAYGTDIPLVIMESPYRSLVGPLLRYIDAVQKERSDDIVTIVLPELVSRKLWHALLHNQAGPLLKLALLNRRDVIVTNVRYFLEH
ncbi:MAG: APC family permease [Janthinobacterium lividum]